MAAVRGCVSLPTDGVATDTADWSVSFEMDLESPVSLRNALGFGVFLLVAVGRVALWNSVVLAGGGLTAVALFV